MTVQEEVRERIARDPQLVKLRQKIERGKASYTDTAAYSIRAGKLLGEIFSRRLPEIPPEEREQLCVDLLHDQYIDINAAVDTAQRFMDEAQGLHLAPQHAPFDAGRGHQIGSALRDLSKPVEVLQRRAKAAPETAVKAIHDDRMKTEAKFRHNAGLDCRITRVAVNGCCPWCSKVAGRYAYGEEPDDIYRRHDNCDCTVTFENGRKRQDVWSKQEWEAPEEDAGAPEPTRLTAEQARELEANAQLRALVYDMANPVKAYRGKDITLHRVTTAHNALYVSDGARQTAKPKIIHEIDMHVLEALKMLGITGKDNLPNIYVIDSFEMGKNAAAAYNAITNKLHLNLSVAIYGKNTIPAGMEIFACFEDDHSSYIHELIHWQDAQRFIERYGEVTDENYSQYLQFINHEAKKKLDKLIESGYNIADLSDYAVDQYRKGKYYEAYTEYRVEQVMKEGFQ